MVVGAARGECGGDTDDETLARGKLIGQLDLVAGRVFEELDVGDGVTNFDLRISHVISIWLHWNCIQARSP